MTRSLRLLSLVALAVSASTVPALAGPTKVALIRIDGDTTGLGKAVVGALDDTELEVVSGKQVARAIERLGLSRTLGERDIVKLATELEVDAVVKGVFDRRGHTLRLTIFSNGKKGKPFSLQVDNAGSDRFRKLVRTTMVAKLASAVPADEDRPARGKARAKREGDEVADADQDDRPARGKTKAPHKADEPADEDRPARGKAKARANADEAADDSERPARTKAKARAKTDEVAEDGDRTAKARPKTRAKADEVAEDSERPARTGAKPAAGDDVDGSKRPDPAARHGVATAAAGGESPPESTDAAPRTAAPRVATRDQDDATPSVRARQEPNSAGTGRGAGLAALRVDLGASMSGRRLQFQTTAFAEAPRPYSNAPVLGGRIEAEFYPFALVDPSSLLAGFGVAADYDRTMSLTLRASEEMTVPLKITEQHYSFGVRYRLAFGHRPTSPTLTVGTGYGARTFAVDRGGLMTADSLDLPDVDYKMFDPGLAFRMPLGDTIAITAAGRGLLVTSAGAIQAADQYGKASVLGATASLGVDVAIGHRIAVRVAAEATQLSFKFAGTGTLATSRDGDSSTVDVSGATDRYYGAAATLAVMY